jgi:hypothetical protein
MLNRGEGTSKLHGLQSPIADCQNVQVQGLVSAGNAVAASERGQVLL